MIVNWRIRMHLRRDNNIKGGIVSVLSRLLRISLWASVLCLSHVLRGESGEGQILKIGTFQDPPFVENDHGRMKGFTVDLWESIANRIATPYEWKQYDNADSLLKAVAKGEVDVAAADLSITSERHQLMDFSHPYFETGLRIMISEKRHVGFVFLLGRFVDSGHLQIISICLLVLLAVTLVVMVAERRFNKEFPSGKIEGFAESLFHVVSVLLKGQTNHKPIPGATGRFFTVLWMVCGVSTVSYVTAVAASVMTTSALHQQINGPSDLADKSVGTIKGTTGQIYLSRKNISCQLFSDVPEAADALTKRYIDAIVYDAPALEYYDEHHPEQPVTEVGPLFDRQVYGFVFPLGSKLRWKVNGELLKMIENESLEKLRIQYFGNTR